MSAVDPVQWRAAADAIDAAFTGPRLDRQARYAAAYLRRRADEAEAWACNCHAGGPEFVPAGHYADCPQADL